MPKDRQKNRKKDWNKTNKCNLTAKSAQFKLKIGNPKKREAKDRAEKTEETTNLPPPHWSQSSSCLRGFMEDNRLSCIMRAWLT